MDSRSELSFSSSIHTSGVAGKQPRIQRILHCRVGGDGTKVRRECMEGDRLLRHVQEHLSRFGSEGVCGRSRQLFAHTTIDLNASTGKVDSVVVPPKEPRDHGDALRPGHVELVPAALFIIKLPFLPPVKK